VHPDAVSFDVGASLGVPALTAHRALTVAEDGAKLATAAGAHHTINYREGDPAAAIRAIAPDGVDIVAEVALGANLTLDLAVLRTRGTIATYANDGGHAVDSWLTEWCCGRTRRRHGR
jgi:NADPH2:quinone reductase